MGRLVFAIAVLISFCLSCIGGPEVVRMGTEGAYPPYNFINDKGEVDGFERELGDELCRRADLECVWVTNEWGSIIPNLLEGKYDTIMAGMSITAERDEVIDFTQPYIPPSPSVYVALAGPVTKRLPVEWPSRWPPSRRTICRNPAQRWWGTSWPKMSFRLS